MDIWQSLSGQAHWVWIAIGILLCASEMVVAGIFLLWFGIAAIVTGILVAMFPIGGSASLVVFAILSVGSVLIGWRLFGSREDATDQPFLNRRAESTVGKHYVLAHPIKGGVGTLTINDTSWRIRGPDMPAGTRIRVTSVEDAVVLVIEQD